MSSTGSAAPRRVLVTGGGTAGHVLPALAIMDRLVAAGHPPADLHYVGAERGIEARLVPPTGYAHTLLDVVGLQRSLSLRNLTFLPKLVRAVWRARHVLQRVRPNVVVNVGGYASMPATLAARLAKIPVIVVSYDRRPGLASRVAARFATCTASAFEGSLLPRAQLTGAPIRAAIIAVDRERGRRAAREALGWPPERFVIAVFGGSLGAQALNDAVADLVDRCADRRDLAVHHVAGARFVDAAAPSRHGDDGIMYDVIAYEDRMPEVYAAADLMVTRGGASTIAELAATGTPAIVVPWPGAADNHQLDNARTLSDHDAAMLVRQHELTGARLQREIDRFLADPTTLADIGRAAHRLGARHRSNSLIELIDAVAAR